MYDLAYISRCRNNFSEIFIYLADAARFLQQLSSAAVVMLFSPLYFSGGNLSISLFSVTGITATPPE